MSTQRSVLQRRSWDQTFADLEEIARLLHAGERLLRKSRATRGNPSQSSRRSSQGYYGRRTVERKHGKCLLERELVPEVVVSTRLNAREQPDKNSPSTEGEKLIPGIPDDVVLNHVLTKIGWEKLVSLSCVSPAWRDIINQREVYNSRLRHNSTHTFIAIVHKAPGPSSTKLAGELPFRDFVAHFYEDNDPVPPEHHLAISLYNPLVGSWQLLPPIPQVNCGIPRMAACVVVAGRMYVLGGEGHKNRRCAPRKSVYMLDLVVGHRVWKACASMSVGRSDFACGVIDGKIYVAGGWSHLDHVWSEGEVYNPVTNTWEHIVRMPTPRLNYTVGILDNQLYVVGGSVFRSFPEDDNIDFEGAEWADVYDPRSNQWGRVEKIGTDQNAACVVTNEKLISLHSDSIDVYDKYSRSWRVLMPNSWEVLESTGALFCSARAATDANGELLTFVRWMKGWPYEITLLQTKDFSRWVNEETQKRPSPTWSTVKCPHEFDRDFFFLVPVKL